MKTSRLFSTVEAHTGGEPFRIITSGAPRNPGKTILERCAWIQENAMNQASDHARAQGAR